MIKLLITRDCKIFKYFKNLLYSCDIGLSTVILRKNLIKKNIKVW